MPPNACCPTCLEGFARRGAHQPKVLQCGHTHCLGCLVRSHRSSATGLATCVLCLRPHPAGVPWPTNHALLQMLESDVRISEPQPADQTRKEHKMHQDINTLLSQISQETLGSICSKLVRLKHHCVSTLQFIAEQVIDRVVTEPSLCQLYAQLCLSLSRDLPDFPGDSKGQLDRVGKPVRISFRRTLLNMCQTEFDKGVTAPESMPVHVKATKPVAKPDKATLDALAYRRFLGTTQFLGHLYKQGMLTENIMHSCILHLLGDSVADDDSASPSPKDVECVCKLMATIGYHLDANPHNKMKMSAYFHRLDRWSKDLRLESRLRFLLKDIIGLRNAGWVEP